MFRLTLRKTSLAQTRDCSRDVCPIRLMRMEGVLSPPTLIASKRAPLRSFDRHTSLSLVFGKVFTDSTLESSGRLVARMMPKTNTRNHFLPCPCLCPSPHLWLVDCGSKQNSQTCARLVGQTVAHPSVALLNAKHTCVPVGVVRCRPS